MTTDPEAIEPSAEAERFKGDGGGWAAVAIVLVFIILALFAWKYYRATHMKAQSDPAAHVNLTLPAGTQLSPGRSGTGSAQ